MKPNELRRCGTCSCSRPRMKPHSTASRERHSGFSGYPWRSDLADSISGPGKQRSRLTAGSCRAFDCKRALSVAMTSIANLESIRSALGEDAARTALIEGAKYDRSLRRSWDTLGRYGDKLFISILRDARCGSGPATGRIPAAGHGFSVRHRRTDAGSADSHRPGQRRFDQLYTAGR